MNDAPLSREPFAMVPLCLLKGVTDPVRRLGIFELCLEEDRLGHPSAERKSVRQLAKDTGWNQSTIRRFLAGNAEHFPRVTHSRLTRDSLVTHSTQVKPGVSSGGDSRPTHDRLTTDSPPLETPPPTLDLRPPPDSRLQTPSNIDSSSLRSEESRPPQVPWAFVCWAEHLNLLLEKPKAVATVRLKDKPKTAGKKLLTMIERIEMTEEEYRHTLRWLREAPGAEFQRTNGFHRAPDTMVRKLEDWHAKAVGWTEGKKELHGGPNAPVTRSEFNKRKPQDGRWTAADRQEYLDRKGGPTPENLAEADQIEASLERGYHKLMKIWRESNAGA